MWLLTVAPEMRSLSAISALDRPAPISVSTSTSRWVSPSGEPDSWPGPPAPGAAPGTARLHRR